MCGLVAIFAYGAEAPPVDQDELLAIRDTMARRGPDGSGLWISGDARVGLAHRRLAIIDLSSAAAQPMASADGRQRVVHNGEIYNFRELKGELETQGQVFASQSDTEVLLHLYRRYGPAMVHRLRGMYAFAIWDEERHGVFLARDPMGIKPLYYADDGCCLRVASQVKALVAGGAVDTSPDAAGHAGFFLFGYVPEPHTLYKGIKALPAGESLWIDGAGPARRERHFDIARVLAGEDPGDGAMELREALADSVRHHLVADVPVGVFLSSGLDSATITGLASEAGGARLETVTLAFEEFRGTPRDEAPLAEAVARAYGTSHHTRRVAARDFHDHLEDLTAAMDQPSIDGVNVYFVAREAAALGLKVALSGLGGDELFAGYDSFRQIPALVRGLGPVPGLGALGKVVRRLAAPLAGRWLSPKMAGVLEYGTRYGDAYLLRRGLYMPWELPRVMDPDMARQGLRELQPLARLAECHAPVSEPRNKVMILEMAWYMRNQLLRDADWAGMAHSLEIRVPLVDEVLFRALAGRGHDKRQMALTPAKPLPREVLDRPKTGFFVPVGEWLRGQAPDGKPEHGLRGWARQVYGAATGGTYTGKPMR